VSRRPGFFRLDPQKLIVDGGDELVFKRHRHESAVRLPAPNPLGPGRALQSRAMRLTVVLVVLAFVAAGCSSGEPSAYKAEPTAKCLRGKSFDEVTTESARIGVIAAAAPNGGLRAFEPGNTLTIAFGENNDDALAIERAFRRFAPRKLRRHITDVMRTQKNAVMLWTVTPPLDEQNTVFGCLKG
jgi:hypothetical protein